MDDWQKEINWKVVAIEKIVNRLLSDVSEITESVREIEKRRNEIQKTVDRQEKKDRQFQAITMKKTEHGLTFAHQNANWIVKQKSFYIQDGTGTFTLTTLEELLKDKAKVDQAMKLYPNAFSKTKDIQSQEAAETKKAAPKKTVKK